MWFSISFHANSSWKKPRIILWENFSSPDKVTPDKVRLYHFSEYSQ